MDEDNFCSQLHTWKAAMASLSDFSCRYSATTDLQRPSASACCVGDAAGAAAAAAGCCVGTVGGRPEPAGGGVSSRAGGSSAAVSMPLDRGLRSSFFRSLWR